MAFGSHQRVVFEKRDNDPHEVTAALHRETPHRTAMVVVPTVPDQCTHAEVLPEELQRMT
jgi:hypothetical protein